MPASCLHKKCHFFQRKSAIWRAALSTCNAHVPPNVTQFPPKTLYCRLGGPSWPIMAPNGARKRCMQECCHGVTSCFVKRVQCFCVCFFYTFYFTHQGSTPIGKFECGTGCSGPSCASQALNQLDQPGHHLRFSSGFLNSGWQARKDAIRRPACSGLHILPIRVHSSPSLSFGNRSEPNSLIPWTHTKATTD